MKNKKLTYILGFAVLVIWVLIFRQIFDFMRTKNDTISAQPFIPIKQDSVYSTDTIVLIADYPDPFLKGNSSYKNKVPKQTNRAKNTEERKAEVISLPVQWPEIRFDGIIKSDKKVQGLLNINETQYIVSEGNLYDNVLIKSIGKDSIVVIFKNRTKAISR